LVVGSAAVTQARGAPQGVVERKFSEASGRSVATPAERGGATQEGE